MPKYNTLGKKLFVVCIYFAEWFLYDTRQIPYLPSARKNTLSKRLSTRQTSSFPVVQLHYKMCVGDIFILYLTCNLISLNLGDILYGISLLELYKEEDSTIFQH